MASSLTGVGRSKCSAHLSSICFFSISSWVPSALRRANTQCSGNKTQADIVFVLDRSGSLGVDNFQAVLRFVKGLITDFDIAPNKVRIGVQTFSSDTEVAFHLNEYQNKTGVFDAIDNIGYFGGNTNTGRALEFLRTDMFAEKNGDRRDVTNIAVVMSDGDSNDPRHTAVEAQNARDAGIRIFSVGLGTGITQLELNEIATDPDSDHVFYVTNFDALPKIKAAFQAQACVLVHGAWGAWQEWGACSVTCRAVGVRSRVRECNDPTPKYGGNDCVGERNNTETCDFTLTSCGAGIGWAPLVYGTTMGPPVHGGFSYWGQWSQCSRSCGAGVRVRTRKCNNPVPEYGGDECAGDYFLTETCNNFICPSPNDTYVQYCSGREFFTCETGTECLPILKKCNCQYDCADGSDETVTYARCNFRFEDCRNPNAGSTLPSIQSTMLLVTSLLIVTSILL